jgi:hypothetical protein
MTPAPAALFLLLAQPIPTAPRSFVLVDDHVRVGASRIRTLDVAIAEPGMRVSCVFSVVEGASGVRVLLLTQEDAESWARGEAHSVLAGTPFTRAASFARTLMIPGSYRVVLDNRMEGRGAATVRLRVEVTSGREQARVRGAHPLRAQILVWSSVLLFGAVSLFAGVRIRRAVERRDARESMIEWLPPCD